MNANVAGNLRRAGLALLAMWSWLLLMPVSARAALYTHVDQFRALQVELTGRAGNQPQHREVEYTESGDLGTVEAAIGQEFTERLNDAFITGRGDAAQRIAVAPDHFSGLLTAGTSAQGAAAEATGNVFSAFSTVFRIDGPANIPFVLTGRLRSVFDPLDQSADADAGIVLLDLVPGQEDADVVFARAIHSDTPFDEPFQGSGILMPGHDYELIVNANVATGLRAASPVETSRVSLTSEVDFALTLPEPAAPVLIVFASSFLSSRRWPHARS